MKQQQYHECTLFVKELHQKQVDKGGNPYYLHLYEVAESAKLFCQKLNIDDENFIYDCMQIALLHDSVEDCDLSLNMIQQKYGDEISKGVDLMTKSKHHRENNNLDGVFHSDYVDYLGRLYQAYLEQHSYAVKAMIVKMSDLKSNLNYTRLGVVDIYALTQKQVYQLLKYHTTYQVLSNIIFKHHKMTIDEFKNTLLSVKIPQHIDIDALKLSIQHILK